VASLRIRTRSDGSTCTAVLYVLNGFAQMEIG
jgi:hypothetical protein